MKSFWYGFLVRPIYVFDVDRAAGGTAMYLVKQEEGATTKVKEGEKMTSEAQQGGST